MKYLIMDCDGVLNQCGHGSEHFGLSEDKIRLIHRIITKTGCKIILSSSWRRYPLMKSRVEAVIPIHDSTPILDREQPNGLWSCPERGEEIKAWLGDNLKLDDKAVILDDDPSAEIPGMEDLFFKTQSNVGLTGVLAQEIITRLNS